MERLYRNFLKKAMTSLCFSVGVLLSLSPVLAAVPNDIEYNKQAPVYEQIGAPNAWEVTTGTRRVVVAVIDTGLDTWQDDMRANVWTNPLEIPDNGKDDDNNGYVDDVHGWNFVENNNDVRTSVFDNADDPEAVRHGTLVGGLIGAVGNNAYEGTGLNWQVSLMPLRAIQSNGTGSMEVVAAAIDYAVANGAQIISMSFVGTESSITLYKSLRQAYEKGVVIITAAGNNDAKVPERDLDVKKSYPACYDREDGLNQNWILTVGSVDNQDRLSAFSNYGSCVDIVAPGEGIYSAERYAPQFGYADEFGGPWQGTSFATPLVAGAAALLKTLHPEWTPQEIISTLLASVDSIDAINTGYAGKLGAGRLNVGKAVSMAALRPMSHVLGSIYYTKPKQLWRLNLATNQAEKLASFPEATIIAMNPFRLEPIGVEGVTLILKRGSFYYLHILKADGSFFKELAIKGPKGTSLLQPVGAKVFSTADGLAFIIEQANSRQATFSFFDSHGVKVGEKTFAYVPASWVVDGTTQTLITARLRGTKLDISRYSFVDKKASTITIDKVSRFDGMQINPPDGSGAALTILVEKNNKLALALAVLATNKLKELPLASVPYSKKDTWKLKVLPLGATVAVLPYTLASRTYQVFNADGSLLTSVKLTSLPATAQ